MDFDISYSCLKQYGNWILYGYLQALNVYYILNKKSNVYSIDLFIKILLLNHNLPKSLTDKNKLVLISFKWALHI